MGVATNYTYQAKPAGATLTDLYTVPAGRRANVKLFAANQDATVPEAIRVAISPLGAADATSQYIRYDAPLAITVTAGSDLEVTGIKLRATDKLRVQSLNGDVSFTANVYEDDQP